MKIIVYHGGYGCDTGCCGHWVKVDGKDVGGFEFSHPYGENALEYAQQVVRERFGEDRVKDLDWDNCVIGED